MWLPAHAPGLPFCFCQLISTVQHGKARDFCNTASEKPDKLFLGKHLHKSDLSSFIIVPGNTRVACRNNMWVHVCLDGFSTWKYPHFLSVCILCLCLKTFKPVQLHVDFKCSVMIWGFAGAEELLFLCSLATKSDLWKKALQTPLLFCAPLVDLTKIVCTLHLAEQLQKMIALSIKKRGRDRRHEVVPKQTKDYFCHFHNGLEMAIK